MIDEAKSSYELSLRLVTGHRGTYMLCNIIHMERDTGANIRLLSEVQLYAEYVTDWADNKVYPKTYEIGENDVTSFSEPELRILLKRGSILTNVDFAEGYKSQEPIWAKRVATPIELGACSTIFEYYNDDMDYDDDDDDYYDDDDYDHDDNDDYDDAGYASNDDANTDTTENTDITESDLHEIAHGLGESRDVIVAEAARILTAISPYSGVH